VVDAEVVLLTACNQACPASARYFGDLENPESTVSRLARSPRAFVLLEDLGTEPRVYYLKGE
jgi:molybdopterin-containing oxidoreductase family iron-sulfur binding subunit